MSPLHNSPRAVPPQPKNRDEERGHVWMGCGDLRIVPPDAHLPPWPMGKCSTSLIFLAIRAGTLQSEQKLQVPGVKLENCYLITPRHKSRRDLQQKRKRRRKGVNNQATPELVNWDHLTSLLESQSRAQLSSTKPQPEENCLEADVSSFLSIFLILSHKSVKGPDFLGEAQIGLEVLQNCAWHLELFSAMLKDQKIF